MNYPPKEDPVRGAEALDPLEVVMRYHQETKHHFFRYARSLGYMDWANQPDPFRRYEGAPLSVLPLLKPDEAPLSPLYEDLYRGGVIVSAPINMRSLSRFFEYSLAISVLPETFLGGRGDRPGALSRSGGDWRPCYGNRLFFR